MKKVSIVSKETGIPKDSIYRYVRSGKLTEGIDYDHDLENCLRVKPESIIDYRKTCKPTGRPKKTRRVFTFNWFDFYLNMSEKYGTVKEFLNQTGLDRGRYYQIKNGVYPRPHEEAILRGV